MHKNNSRILNCDLMYFPIFQPTYDFRRIVPRISMSVQKVPGSHEALVRDILLGRPKIGGFKWWPVQSLPRATCTSCTNTI
jgi:hypothetical protein